MLWDLQMDRQIQADQLGIAKIDKEQEAAVRTPEENLEKSRCLEDEMERM